jgi:hypothetical protein
MTPITVAVIGLSISVLGAVWRMSSLVSQLRNIGDTLTKLHVDFEVMERQVSSLKLSVAVLQERISLVNNQTPSRAFEE